RTQGSGHRARVRDAADLGPRLARRRPGPARPLSHRLRVAVAFAISLGLFAYLLSSVDLRQLGRQLLATNWAWAAFSVVAGLGGLAIVSILAMLVLVIPLPRVIEWAAGVLLVIDVVGVSVLVSMVRAPEAGRRLLLRLTGRWPAAARTVVSIFDTGLRGLDGIRTPSHLPRLAAWTALVWLLPAAAAWTMLRAVHLDLPFRAGWTVLAFVGVGISVPSAPGYVGVFHAAATAALEV